MSDNSSAEDPDCYWSSEAGEPVVKIPLAMIEWVRSSIALYIKDFNNNVAAAASGNQLVYKFGNLRWTFVDFNMNFTNISLISV